VAESAAYDAVVVVSFGGPEGHDEVLPFLDNVLRGRHVPPGRIEEVARHYWMFGGVSPLNAQNRALIATLKDELARHGPHVPIYWGNRNWHPFLSDTVRQMRDDGIQRALAFVTSAYGSYSGCRQYLDDIARARADAGVRAPVIDKLRLFYNHPGFVEPNADNLRTELDASRGVTQVLFSAHSVPVSMAATSEYVAQLTETAGLVAERAKVDTSLPWHLVFQSRSGSSDQAWLAPDIRDQLRTLAGSGIDTVVVSPIGFTSDHMEVVYDLDTEARRVATDIGLGFLRVATVGTAPSFVTMIRQLMEERLDQAAPRLALGRRGAYPDVCPPGCCPASARVPAT
jgi:ferrochelatase